MQQRSCRQRSRLYSKDNGSSSANHDLLQTVNANTVPQSETQVQEYYIRTLRFPSADLLRQLLLQFERQHPAYRPFANMVLLKLDRQPGLAPVVLPYFVTTTVVGVAGRAMSDATLWSGGTLLLIFLRCLWERQEEGEFLSVKGDALQSPHLKCWQPPLATSTLTFMPVLRSSASL